MGDFFWFSLLTESGVVVVVVVSGGVVVVVVSGRREDDDVVEISVKVSDVGVVGLNGSLCSVDVDAAYERNGRGEEGAGDEEDDLRRVGELVEDREDGRRRPGEDDGGEVEHGHEVRFGVLRDELREEGGVGGVVGPEAGAP